jgi:hypothetical protein
MTAFVNGQLDPSNWFGTSLASPTFASVLTLVITPFCPFSSLQWNPK